MAAVTVCNNFGAWENKLCHCFHSFPICLPWSDRVGQKDYSDFSVRCYGKTQMNFLANPVEIRKWTKSTVRKFHDQNCRVSCFKHWEVPIARIQVNEWLEWRWRSLVCGGQRVVRPRGSFWSGAWAPHVLSIWQGCWDGDRGVAP